MEVCVDALAERPAEGDAGFFPSSRELSRRSPRSAVSPALPRASERAVPARQLDGESQAWWDRLHGAEPGRDHAIAELHERLRREAWFHVRLRTRGMSDFPASDVDDLAVMAANDALLAILRKLEGYRGESQFWTWARRFVQLEAPVSIRRRMGHDHLADDPERACAVADHGCSPQERAEVHELLRRVSDLIVGQLTTRQRNVLIATAINGQSTGALAIELDTTPGAIYKALHDARRKLTAQLALH